MMSALVISAFLAVADGPAPLTWCQRALLVAAGAAAFVARVWL
jgi:hypothetical protein